MIETYQILSEKYDVSNSSGNWYSNKK